MGDHPFSDGMHNVGDINTPRQLAQGGSLFSGGGQALGRNTRNHLWYNSPHASHLERTTKVVSKLEKEIKDVTKARKKLEAVTTTAQRKTRSRKTGRMAMSRKGFGVSGDGIKAGPILIGRGGISPDQTFMRNAGGHAFTASLGIHIMGAAVGGINNIAAGVSNVALDETSGSFEGAVARTAGLGVGKGLATTAFSLVGGDSIVREVVKAAGFSDADYQNAYARAVSDLFDTREVIAANKKKRKDVVLESQRQVERFFDDLWERINKTMPQTFTLRGKSELGAYRRDMENVNRKNLDIRRDALIKDARRRAFNSMQGIP